MANLNIPKKPGLPGYDIYASLLDHTLLVTLHTLRKEFDFHSFCSDMTIRTSGKGNKQFAHQKVAELKKLVEGFVDSMGLGYFNEFFCGEEAITWLL